MNISLTPINPDDVRLSACYYSDNLCLRCGASFFPSSDTTKGFYLLDGAYINAFIIEFCPACNCASIREYYHIRQSIISPDPGMSCRINLNNGIERRFPKGTNLINFSDCINETSHRFNEIFNQASMAEKMGLNEICGMGYRKALEFLIKDYLIRLFPESKDEIFEELLSKSIKRIQNKEIKTLALACSWLGNDAAHYLYKHPDYSLADIKEFIASLIHLIENEVAVNKSTRLLNS